MMQYVKTLERRVKQLEEEKQALEQKIGQNIIPSENSSWDNDVGIYNYLILYL